METSNRLYVQYMSLNYALDWVIQNDWFILEEPAPDLTPIRTYFTRWLIRTTSLIQIHMIFAKSYVFYELQNSYEFVRMTYT